MGEDYTGGTKQSAGGGRQEVGGWTRRRGLCCAAFLIPRPLPRSVAAKTKRAGQEKGSPNADRTTWDSGHVALEWESQRKPYTSELCSGGRRLVCRGFTPCSGRAPFLTISLGLLPDLGLKAPVLSYRPP